MSTVAGITTMSIDSVIDNQDFDPLFSLLNVIAGAASEFVEWYEEISSDLEEAVEMMNWFYEQEAGTSSFEDASISERRTFTEWMDAIGFDWDRYFDDDRGIILVTDQGVKNIGDGVADDIDSDDVESAVSLLELEVNEISANSEQSALYVNAITENYSEMVDELMNLIDTQRTTGRSHLRR